MDYKQKYLKYKMKYLQTKNLVSQNNSLRGGAAVAEPEYINEQQFNQLPLLEKFKYTEYYRRKTAEEMQADNNYVLGQEQIPQIIYNSLTNSRKLFYTQRTQINDNQQNNLNRNSVSANVGQPYMRNTNLLNFAIANQNNQNNQASYIQVSVYDTLQNDKTYYNSNSKIYSRKTNDQIFEILINLERNINSNQYQDLSLHFKSLYNKMSITEDPNTYTLVPTPFGLQRIAKYQLKQEVEQLQPNGGNGEAA
jgi:hypothetical protein